MRAYRVAWVDRGWESLQEEDPFHPMWVPVDRQGGGRFDNRHRYAALYLATSPQSAVGEAFGNSSVWIEAEIVRAKEGRSRSLVTLEVDDGKELLDLDDPQTLVELGLRPSDVRRRNRDHTQEVALALSLDMAATGTRGLRWRSYWRPEWEVLVLWSNSLDPPWFPFVSVVDVEELRVGHPAVVLAADVLPRELR
ncbi:MAG: RES family NAD+ phosphorylase [Acidimicrobiales bacterium]